MGYLILWFVKGIGFILYYLPQKIQFFFGDCLGFLWFDVFRIRRSKAINNLKIVFPEKLKKERIKIARDSVYHLGRCFVEFLTLPFITDKWVEKNVIIEGLEFFEQAQEEKKGVLLFTLHVGNGDLGVSMLAKKGLPMYLITKHISSEWLNKFWFSIRTKHGAKFIEPRKSSFDILKALKRNAGVIFVQDQYAGKPIGIRSTFFGVETGTAYGLTLFALKTRAPILPLYTYRDQKGKTHLVFLPRVELEIFEDKEKTIQVMTEKFNRILEQIIILHPDQWLWVHRRWKEFVG